MKKQECAIVQDLLVLYEDDVLQEESRRMVEEHIRGCEECMRIYEQAGRAMPEFGQEEKTRAAEDEKRREEGAIRVMKRLKRWADVRAGALILSGVLALLLVIAAANAACSHFLEYGDRGLVSLVCGMSSDEIRVKEMYRLANGDIYCTLETDRRIGQLSASYLSVPDDDWSKSTDRAYNEIHLDAKTFWEDEIPGTASPRQITLIFALEGTGVSKKTGEAYTYSCGRILYRGNRKGDSQVLWKKGQSVPEAPEKIQKQAVREYLKAGETPRAMEQCEALGWSDDRIREALCGALSDTDTDAEVETDGGQADVTRGDEGNTIWVTDGE